MSHPKKSQDTLVEKLASLIWIAAFWALLCALGIGLLAWSLRIIIDSVKSIATAIGLL